MGFIKRHIFVLFVVFQTVGILIGNWSDVSDSFLFWSVISSFILYILAFIFVTKRLFQPLVFTVIASFFILFSIFSIVSSKPSLPPTIQTSDAFVAVLTQAPEMKSKSVKCNVELITYHDSSCWIDNNSKLLLYLKKDSAACQLEAGDQLFVGVPLTEVSPPKNPEGFDYKTFLLRKGITMQVYADSSQWLVDGKQNRFNPIAFAGKIRNSLLKTLIHFGLHGDELAVASAILLGYDNYLDAGLRQAYVGAGAMHILCVSGMHVGIVFLVISLLLSPLKRYRWGRPLRTVILLLFIWFYALLTGFSPSIFRATLMLSFVIIGSGLKRKTSVWDSLAASAFVMLLVNPLLLFDVGFQLSYAAVISIVALQPPLYKLWPQKNKFGKSVWSLVTVSIAAQIGTGPIAVLYFHQFPNYFLITNLYVMLFCLAVIYLGMAFFAFSFFPWLCALLAKLLGWVIVGMNWGIRLIDALPGSVSGGIVLSLFGVLMLYGSIFFFFQYAVAKKHRLLPLSLLCVLLFFSDYSWRGFLRDSQESLVIYHYPRHFLADIVMSKSAIQLSDKAVDVKDKSLSYVANEHRLKWGYHQNLKPIDLSHASNTFLPLLDSCCWVSEEGFLFGGQSFVLFKDIPENCYFTEPLEVDFLIINGSVFDSVSAICKVYNPGQIIVTTAAPSYIASKIEVECRALNRSCYNIWEEGAFMLTCEPVNQPSALAFFSR